MERLIIDNVIINVIITTVMVVLIIMIITRKTYVILNFFRPHELAEIKKEIDNDLKDNNKKIN